MIKKIYNSTTDPSINIHKLIKQINEKKIDFKIVCDLHISGKISTKDYFKIISQTPKNIIGSPLGLETVRAAFPSSSKKSRR